MSAVPQTEPARRPVLVSPDMVRVHDICHQIASMVMTADLDPFFARRRLEDLLANAPTAHTDPAWREVQINQFIEARGITPKEKQVLDQLVQGLPNQAIAKALFMAEQTVKFHLTQIYRKLEVFNRTEAVTTWLEATT